MCGICGATVMLGEKLAAARDLAQVPASATGGSPKQRRASPSASPREVRAA
jgi:hypothetical protein